MELILELAKYVLPAAVVFATSYFMLRAFLEKEERKKLLEINLGNQKITTPLRLQAYERVILFLERISPDSLVIRTQTPGMTCKEHQSAMLAAIRSEYEHNLSQQVYISAQAWEGVRNAKESITKLINAASMRMQPESTAMDLSKTIFEMYISVDESPTVAAISVIKNEVSSLF